MKTLSINKIVLFFIFTALCFIFMSHKSSFAQNATNVSNTGGIVQDANGNENDNDLVRVMCNALKLVTGNAGKTFAAFAIISMGIGFFTGKVSWGLIIGVMLGIAAVFGAPTIVSAIGGGTAYKC